MGRVGLRALPLPSACGATAAGAAVHSYPCARKRATPRGQSRGGDAARYYLCVCQTAASGAGGAKPGGRACRPQAWQFCSNVRRASSWDWPGSTADSPPASAPKYSGPNGHLPPPPPSAGFEIAPRSRSLEIASWRATASRCRFAWVGVRGVAEAAVGERGGAEAAVWVRVAVGGRQDGRTGAGYTLGQRLVRPTIAVRHSALRSALRHLALRRALPSASPRLGRRRGPARWRR